jgi:hypothetical protein
MRKFVLVAAIVVTAIDLASAGAQAADSRSLSTISGESPAATSYQSKPGTLRAETGTTATPAAIPAPPPLPAAETPRYALPPTEPKAIEAPRPVDTTRNTEPSATTRRYNARPAAIDTTPPATVTPYRQPPRQANYRRSQMRHASYGRPHYRIHRWNTGRIIAALHRYGIYW